MHKGPYLRSIIKLQPIDRRAVGLRIRAARKTRGWYLADLAKVTGVKRSTIANYECGTRIPVTENLLLISIALRRTMAFLLTGRRERVRTKKKMQSVASLEVSAQLPRAEATAAQLRS